ncbi:MAG: aldehyde dehydrogenase (NADP(+)) [Bacteroidota bacterium]
MSLSGQTFIGSKTSGKGSKKFYGIDPTTNQNLDTEFIESTPEEIDDAITQAEKAFYSYRKTTNEQRAAFLEAIGDEIMALGDDLLERGSKETALPIGRLTGERGRTVNQLKLFASMVRDGWYVESRIDTAQPDRQPLPKPDIRQMKVPLGPVGIFGASNFPLAFSVAGGDTASALAAGCPVVFKGHPAHPGTSEYAASAIVKAAKKTGMPDGVFSMIIGTSIDVGSALVKHPAIKAIGFTGSFRGGKALFDLANQRQEPIPVYAEMGSSNPVFILPDAQKTRGKEIGTQLAGSVTMGVGQFCTNPGLTVLPRSENTEELLTALSEGLNQFEGTMLTEGIKGAFNSGVGKFSGNGIKKLTSDKSSNGVVGQAYQVEYAAFKANPALAEEVFGPSTLVVDTQDKDQILDLARNLEGHLTATIIGTDKDLAVYSELVEILENKVGRIIFNGYPTGVEVCHSMHHGGPYPATTDSRSTSVGTGAIKRFLRPICYQDMPQDMLPDALKDSNPLKIWRLLNGEMTKDTI